MLFYKQSTNLNHKIKQCKSINQIHQTHAQIITRGLLSLHPSSTSLIFAALLQTFNSVLHRSPPSSHSAAAIHYAATLFNQIPAPSTFCYNTIIRSHTLLSSPQNALGLFAQMRRLCVPPDALTFPFALKACSLLRSLDLGRTLHSQSFKFGFGVDVFICNNLIHLYSVCGRVAEAHKVFDGSLYRDVVSYNVMMDVFVKAGETRHARELFEQMPVRDATSWGTLLAGYAQMKEYKECLELYDQMLDLCTVRPDNIALVSVLSACARLGELDKGKEIHGYIKRSRIQVDGFLSTGLVDLYAKCGYIETAREIFESSRDKNLFTWNALLVGLAMHGHGELLVGYFSEMVKSRVQPDGVTFLGVLTGCSHAGLIDEARQLFRDMEEVYGVHREIKHYGCMADILGRAGLINEAIEMIETMPMSGDVFVWGSLLGGCKLHGDVEVAEKVARHVMEISPEDGGVYSTMANVYADANRWDDLTKIRRLKDSRSDIKKNAGCSSIQLNGFSHEFVAGDDLHPKTDEIYTVLNSIGQHL